MPGYNCLAGILFPAVYVDGEQIDNTEVMDHIIRHELQHYRVRDHYWQFLRVICLILQWHDPFVWWAYFASKQDCEMACDARVVRDMSSGERIKSIMQHKRRYALVLSVIVICVIGALGFITIRVQGKETLSAEEIEGLEPNYHIDISMEAIINGTDGYKKEYETLWGFIDNVQESSGLPYTGGFQYGERG